MFGWLNITVVWLAVKGFFFEHPFLSCLIGVYLFCSFAIMLLGMLSGGGIFESMGITAMFTINMLIWIYILPFILFLIGLTALPEILFNIKAGIISGVIALISALICCLCPLHKGEDKFDSWPPGPYG